MRKLSKMQIMSMAIVDKTRLEKFSSLFIHLNDKNF